MLEIISALTPFLLLGLVAAGLSRLSGVALSMVVVPTLLIWGATAVDVIAFMLLFVVYNNFTMETQDIRLDYKDLVLFPKWRLCIPFILSLVSAVATAVGAYAGPKIPSEFYFVCVGLAILIVTDFAWYAGKHRDAFRNVWDSIWAGFNIFLGMFGIEASYYPAALTRSIPNPMDRMLPMVTVVGGYAGLMVVFGFYNIFSIPSLITAIGAAIGIRLFGMYEFPRNGSFSYLAIGFAV
ncbi:MAG: hypothetical protein E6951_09760, partial [Veillonella parvula]|nr:hypothetical protein [Veillonella parvula]